jgi:hypothetical protein
MDVTFVFPRDTLVSGIRVPFNEFKILNVAGLPNGMSWECNLQPNCTYDLRSSNPNPDTVGCIRIFGTPSLPGSYPLTVQMDVTLPIVGTQPGTYDALLVVSASKRDGACYDLSLNTTCAPASLSLTNRIPSNGNSGFSYDWTITGPNGFNSQTNLENPAPINLTDPGQYIVEYTATVDTVGFVLDSIIITGVSCSDDFGVGAPDIYWIFDDPSGNTILTNRTTPLTNVNPPIKLGPLNMMLQTIGTYKLEVWDEDSGLGGTDDGCADGRNNGDADVSLDLSTATVGANAVTNQALSVVFYLNRPLSIDQCSDTVVIDSLPAVPNITVMGNTSVCAGDSVELMVTSTDSIQWYKDGLLIAGENGNSIFVSENGMYSVEVIDTTSLCRSTSSSTSIDIVDLSAPAISLSGNTFSVDMPQNGVVYVWYVNGNRVSTGPSLLAGSSGYYTAVATDPGSGCASDTSNSILYTAVGLEGLAGLVKEFSVFPNPNQGNFTLAFELLRSAEITISLQDILGRNVYRTQTTASAGTFQKHINLNVEQGMYLLRVEANGQSMVTKVVID